ncbi:MAG: hypothetical protein WCF79_11620 [Rhodomicrobium sp.]
MNKALLTVTAIGFALALAPLTSQKVAAASQIPAVIMHNSPTSDVQRADWEGREHRNYWRFGEHRRYREQNYGNYASRHEGYGREGYRHQRDYGHREQPREENRERRGY